MFRLDIGLLFVCAK